MRMELRISWIAALAICFPAFGADVGAGRAAAQAKCVQCHEADDWEGESAASLESLMRDIAAVAWLPLSQAVERLSYPLEKLFLQSVGRSLAPRKRKSARRTPARKSRPARHKRRR